MPVVKTTPPKNDIQPTVPPKISNPATPKEITQKEKPIEKPVEKLVEKPAEKLAEKTPLTPKNVEEKTV